MNTPATSLPERRLGRTNERVSVIGMGGYHLGKPDLPDLDAARLIHAGIDRGITFLDNSWDYNGGTSELRMGRALAAGGYRDKVFLMTKIDGRSAAAFTEQFEESLQRLSTDRVDLVQFHEIIRPSDADRIFAAGGALEAALAAKAAGKTRYIGFTGHKHPDILLRMFELANRHGFTFDTVQMPLNVLDAHYQSFEKLVLPVALSLDTGIIAMKTFGDHFILDTGAVAPVDMLHYGLNLPVSVVVTGIDRPEILEQAVSAALSFRPLGQDAVRALLDASATFARDGKNERYKSSGLFDSTAQNPQWLG